MSLQQWVQVASVFLAALLARCTGIGLEFFKNWRASTKDREEKQRREVAQLKVAIAGIAFNIESMLHAVFQNLLPITNRAILLITSYRPQKEMVTASASLQLRCTNTRP
jgi:hypothetical protein